MNGEGAPGGVGLAERTPAQSREQGTRPPDILRGVDKELEVARAMTPAISRVLVGSATVNRERFDPDNVTPLDTAPETNESSRLSALAPGELAYDAASRVSLESRAGVTDYAGWEANMKRWVVSETMRVDPGQAERIAALKAIGAITENAGENGPTYTENIRGMYDKYLNNRADIKQFVEDIASGLTNADGAVDIPALKTRLASIEGMLINFGEVHNVNLLVRDFAISRAMLTQSADARKYVVSHAADHITQAVPPDAGERNYLKALGRLAAAPRTTPVSPTPLPSPSAELPLVQNERKEMSSRLYAVIDRLGQDYSPQGVGGVGRIGYEINLTPQEQQDLHVIATLTQKEIDANPQFQMLRQQIESLRGNSGFDTAMAFGNAIIEDATVAQPTVVGSKIHVPSTLFPFWQRQQDINYINGILLDPTNSRGIDARRILSHVNPILKMTHEAGLLPEVTEIEEKFGDYAAAKTINAHKVSEDYNTHEKKKEKHQDRYINIPERGLFAVFDGLGGHGNGELAAQLGRDFLTDAVRFLPTDLSLEQTQDRLLRFVLEANNYVQEEAIRIKSDMGATLSLGYMWESPQGERKLITINLGDSRIYRVRNGKLEMLSNDDNGLTASECEQLDNADTRDDINALPRKLRNAWTVRNKVSSALSQRYPTSVVGTFDVEDNDSYLITSDGIHDNLTRKRIAEIMQANSDPDAAVESLVREAQEKSKKPATETSRGKPDDMTALAFKITSSFPHRNPADTLQAGISGVFAEREAMIRQHDQLIDAAQTRLGRPLVLEEMYYLIDGNDPLKLDRFMQLLPESRRAREGRDTFYQRIKDWHDNPQQTLQKYITTKFRGLTDPIAIMEESIKIIENASTTFSNIDDMLLMLKSYFNYSDDNINKTRNAYGNPVLTPPLQQGETLQYMLYFAHDNNDVTQKIPAFRRIPANYASLPPDVRLRSLVNALYRPTIK